MQTLYSMYTMAKQLYFYFSLFCIFNYAHWWNVYIYIYKAYIQNFYKINLFMLLFKQVSYDLGYFLGQLASNLLVNLANILKFNSLQTHRFAVSKLTNIVFFAFY